MVDLLQLESVSATLVTPKQTSEPSKPVSDDQASGNSCRKAKEEEIHGEDVEDVKTSPSPLPTMDTHPTAANSRFPPLRRAALHFFTLLIRACISRVYDMGPAGTLIPDAYTARARTTLGYVANTDEDAMVRIMAREAMEGLGQLSNALVGL
jgi:hypothetical protein